MAFDDHTEFPCTCASVWQPWEIGLVSQPAKRKLVPRGPLLCELEKPESAEGSKPGWNKLWGSSPRVGGLHAVAPARWLVCFAEGSDVFF